MLGLLIQAAICVMLPEQNAGKGSQKILNSLRVRFGQAGDGMFSEILALLQAQLKSHLVYGAADFHIPRGSERNTLPAEFRVLVMTYIATVPRGSNLHNTLLYNVSAGIYHRLWNQRAFMGFNY